MISVDFVWKTSEDLANKYQTGAQFTPDQFNRYVKIVVYDIARKYYGKPEDYKQGDSSATIAYERTQLITDYLDDLKVSDKLIPITRSGSAKVPDDYLHYDSMEYRSFTSATVSDDTEQQECHCHQTPCTCDKNKTVKRYKAGKLKRVTAPDVIHAPVTVVSSSRFTTYQRDAIRKPSKQYPIAKFTGKKQLQFAPMDLGQVYMTYLRYPLTPKWNYTITGGIAVYSPTGSQNIELPDILTKEVVMGILDCVGINTRELPLTEIAKYFKTTGV